MDMRKLGLAFTTALMAASLLITWDTVVEVAEEKTSTQERRPSANLYGVGMAAVFDSTVNEVAQASRYATVPTLEEAPEFYRTLLTDQRWELLSFDFRYYMLEASKILPSGCSWDFLGSCYKAYRGLDDRSKGEFRYPTYEQYAADERVASPSLEALTSFATYRSLESDMVHQGRTYVSGLARGFHPEDLRAYFT